MLITAFELHQTGYRESIFSVFDLNTLIYNGKTLMVNKGRSVIFCFRLYLLDSHWQ